MRIHDVIILGTGGVGSAALFHLARRGMSVLGIDRFSPGHDRGSSHGETRMIRQAYYEHADYVPLLKRAYELWDELSEMAGRQLLYRCGVLQAGPRDGRVLPGVLGAARQHGLDLEELDPREAMRRYPGFRIPEHLGVVFERCAGYLLVEECVREHARQAVTAGAELHTGETVLEWRAGQGGPIEVVTDRDRYAARRLIVTAGAWAGPMLRNLGIPLEVVRKPLYWFAAPDEPYHERIGSPGFIIETPQGNFYGFPKRDELGLKVAEHTGGESVPDPLALDRTEHIDETKNVRWFLENYMPGVSGEQTHFDVCMYTLSPDRNFLVDQHPVYPDVFFAAGLSGHGFKFTTILGEVLADLAQKGSTKHPIGFLTCRREALKAQP